MRKLVADFVRYFGVSVLALAVDYGGLIFLHRSVGLHYLIAAAFSFLAGLAVAWSLSVAFVFRGRRRLSHSREFVGFLLTGIVGLLLTQLAMSALVSGFGLPAEVAKAPVAGSVFTFNFFSRRRLFLNAAQTLNG